MEKEDEDALMQQAEEAARIIETTTTPGDRQRFPRPRGRSGMTARNMRHGDPGAHAGSKTPAAKKKAKARAKRKATKR